MLLVSLTQGLIHPPGSQGMLCLGGQIGRFKDAVTPASAQGFATFEVDTNAIPGSPPLAVQPGETWSFQVWCRDKNPSQTSNFTDGVAVTFL